MKQRGTDDRKEINITHRLYRIFPGQKWNIRLVSDSFDLSSPGCSFALLFLLAFCGTPALNRRTKQRRNIVRDLRKVFSEIVCVITFWRASSGTVPKIRILFPAPSPHTPRSFPFTVDPLSLGNIQKRGKTKNRNQSDR